MEYEEGRLYIGVGNVDSSRGGELNEVSENRPLFMSSSSCTNSSVGVCFLSSNS